MIKLFFNLIKLIILAAVLSLVFHNYVFSFIFEKGSRLAIGAPVEVGQTKLDFLNAELSFENVTVYNPDGFPAGVMMMIPKIILDLDSGRLFKGKILFEEVEIAVAEIRLLRSPPNGLNLLSLKPFKSDKKKQSSSASKEVLIENLRISVARATFTDLTGPLPLQRSFNLRIDNVVFHDIRSSDDAYAVIANEILKGTGLEKWLQVAEHIEDPKGLMNKIVGIFKGDEES